MAALTSNLRLCTAIRKSPLLTTVRYRRKPNIQRPKIPHFDKALMMKVTKPVYPNLMRHYDPQDLCQERQEWKADISATETTIYEKLLAKECYDKISSANSVAFFHKNPSNGDNERKMYISMYKMGFKLDQYGNKIMRLAFTDTPYSAALALCTSTTTFATSENTNFAKLIKMLKRTNYLVLLGGIVEGELLSRSELDWYSSLPNIDGVRSQLVATLSSPAARVTHSLSHHQHTLSQTLQQLIKQKEEEAAEQTHILS